MSKLRVAVWIAQVILAVFYATAGALKIFVPMDQLPAMIPWTGDFSEGFVRFTGWLDMFAAFGLVLPDMLRIWTWVTILAAFGSAMLQVLAIIFHVWRGEFAVLIINFSALALSCLVLWRWDRIHSPASPHHASVK